VPLLDKRSNLTSADARAADVAAAMVEHVSSIQQQRMISAFRVQGFQSILYNRLSQGIACSCKSAEKTVAAKLNPDGKADVGTINRVLTGEAKFGIGAYNPLSPEAEFDDNDNFHDAETSPNNAMNQWLGDLRKAGPDDGSNNLIVDEPTMTETGQFSPDLDELFRTFDYGSMGLSDISCPLCFGSGYVGGFSPFRGWRQVVDATRMSTTSTLDLTSNPLALRPGTYTFTLTLPFGAAVLDVFRVMNGSQMVRAQILIDGTDTMNKRVLNYFDGQPHLITVNSDSPVTHFEAQAGLNPEPVYFEFPRRNRTQDIALLEKQEPFQIIMSPECPYVDTLDVIAETQSGKLLIVGAVNPWQTRDRNALGQEVQVRVAQPAELFRILPVRGHVMTKDQTTNAAVPSKGQSTSGLGSDTNGFSF
jgi:hypothetical protein